ncbi:hypothetical protein INT44_005188 [Umbelopsis vinacea]|uniref:Ribosomal protein S21 n=1 Tax=Umbelopsis vinacea TaxID=44442 RepID=A0A8H7Q6R2_9FUNG|nr:hypothetical protein INT44_005188 [Umbelopsis vinacea]
MLSTNLLGLSARARPVLTAQTQNVRKAFFSISLARSSPKPIAQDASKVASDSTIDSVDKSANNVLPSSIAFLGSSKTQQPSLAPYTGRSLNVFHNVNNTYRKLNSILAQNNLRRELKSIEYYEKPNVARRRKKIEQNRKLFGALVRKKVALIMQMKQRGM